MSASHMNSRDNTAPLNLSIDILGSSQPFPSPGSAFVPPPVPGLHEFAIRPPSAGRKMSKKDGDDDQPDPRSPLSSSNGCAATPSNASTIPDIDLVTVSATSPNGVDSSTAPMCDSLLPVSQMPPDTSSDPPSRLQPSPHHRPSTNSVTSLASSRPAPPSPAVSRRASGLSRSPSTAGSRPVSGMSTTSSRPVSGVPRSRPVSGSLQPATHTSGTLSRTPSGRRMKDALSMSAVTPFRQEQEQDEATPTQTTAADSLVAPATTTTTTAEGALTPTSTESDILTLIKIRDYGFATSDPRFSGHGPNVPRPNRPSYLARRLRKRSSSASLDSTSSTSSSSENEGENQWEDAGTNGWGGSKWGIGRAWGFGQGIDDGGDAGAGFPSRGDLDRNFGEEDGEDEDLDVDVDEEMGDQFEDDGEGEPPLLPGLYRALYAFDPEGTAEMKLEEDQMVRVVGRGGGVGWAVVAKDGLKDTGVHALVPESYLELVRLDGDEEDA